MSNKTLNQLYLDHCGKVSDKWSLYLTEYERIFADYRNKPIRLLEIGIQNGGSLEIWPKYFKKAKFFVGCDINPDCTKLVYDDPNIRIIHGNSTDPAVLEKIIKCSEKFDIIIDDGSHKSSDIIKSFALYFPILEEGGIFIVEDIHCSYWDIFEGGLFDPFSSISFFKLLIDILNYEHWGIPLDKVDILKNFFSKYEINILNDTLALVHSIEFVNSMCIIRKNQPSKNGLGHRVVSGSLEQVVSGYRELNGSLYRLDLLEKDLGVNLFNHRELNGDCYRLEQIFDKVSNLFLDRSQNSREIHHKTALEFYSSISQQAISTLTKKIIERDKQIDYLKQTVSSYEDSFSWLITKPIRYISRYIKRIFRGSWKTLKLS